MLLEKVRKYYDKEKYDLNCAETIIYAANEEYSMNLSKETLKTMAAFGGGMGVEGVCGAISGSLAVLGILYTVDRSHESDKIKELSKKYIKLFNEKLGSDNCAVLKGKYKKDEIGCKIIVEAAAEVLEKIVLEEGR